METSENIIAIAIGLEDTRFMLSRKIQRESMPFSGCKAKAAVLEFQREAIGNQLIELYKSDLYTNTIKANRESHRPFSEVLKSTSGMNGMQILIANSKLSA